MAKTLAELFVVINAKTDQLQKGLSEVQTSVNKTQGTFGQLGGALKSLLPAATVAGVVMGFREMMVNAAEYGEEISLASQKTGLGVEMLQKLNYLARTNNASLGGLETGMRKLNMVWADAKAGNEAALKTFESLGITFEELKSLSPDQMFERVLKGIANIPDSAVKADTAVKLLGRSGTDLIPVADAFDRMKNGEWPKFLTKEEVANLNAGKESIERLEIAWVKLQQKMAGATWPIITPFLDELGKAVDLLSKLLDGWNKLPPDFKAAFKAGAGPMGFLLPTEAYAAGGIVTRPTFAMVGEAGPEAIIPLDKLSGGASGSLTLNIGSYYGDDMSKRELVRDIQRILSEEGRRSFTPQAKTDVYSVGGHI